jgi:hypothetical protein
VIKDGIGNLEELGRVEEIGFIQPFPLYRFEMGLE